MKAIAQKSLENFFVRILGQIVTLCVGVAIARLLGPAGKGVYSYVTTTMVLIVTLAAGQGSAFAYQLAKCKQPARVVYRAMLRTLAIFSIPIGVVLAAVAFTLPSLHVLLATVASLPFALYMSFANGFFLAASDVRSSNLQTLTQSGVLLAAIPLLFVHGGLYGVLTIWFASYAIASVFSTLRLRRYLAADTTPAPSDYPFKSQFAFGIKTTLNALVEELNLRIDMYLVLMMISARALGIYSIGIGLAGMLWQLSRPISTAAFGRIGSTEENEAAALTAQCMRHSFAFVLVAAVAAFFAGPYLIVLVYGAQFAEAGTVLRLLLPGIVGYCLMPLIATFYSQQLGRPTVTLVLSAISTVVCAAVTAAFIPRYGMAAGAVASSVSYLVAVAIGAAMFVRRTGISPFRTFVLTRDDLRAYGRLFAGVAARIGRVTEVLVR
jgi:O-antigen/teichoic acid export membrane protein